MNVRKTIYSEEHEYLVQRLKEARKEVNLTQKDVAERLGVSQSYVSKVESGQYRVDVIQLSQFAKLYKRNLEFFVK
jgi:transcriptional regulator with XRE-family HTH domain